MFCTCVCGYGQDIMLTADDGLSNTLINCITHTSDNTIWIATENGLNSYDGSTIKKYFYDENNPYSLADNYINSVSETSDGKIWVSTHSGLQVYDPEFNRFNTIDLHLQKNNRVVRPSVQHILERKDGRIYICTSSHGIFEYIADSAAAYQLNCSQVGYILIHIDEDTQGNLWVASGDYGLTKVSPDNRYTAYKFEGRAYGDLSVSAVACDNAGNVYAANSQLGLYMLDAKHNRFEKIDSGYFTYNIRVLDGRVAYVCTEGGGLKRIDPIAKKTVSHSISYGCLNLEAGKVHDVMHDNKGNLWIAFYQKGILRQFSAKYSFGYYGCRSWTKNIIGNTCVGSVYMSKSGLLYVGTDNDGLYIVDTKTDSVKHYVYDGSNHCVPNVIMSILEDSIGNIWLGAFHGGLCVFDPATGKCTYPNVSWMVDQGLRNVYALTIDNHGNIWAGTMGGGLFRINPKKKDIYQIPSVRDGYNFSSNANLLPDGYINCLYHSCDDLLFIGSFRGLFCYDIKNESFISFFNGKNIALEGVILYSVYYDGQYVWAGTGTGLIKASRNGFIKKYSIEGGLPGEMVCSILPDNDGNIWLSTNGGICKFNPEDESCINFYVDDGLQGNEFSKNSCAIANDGTLFFGGMYGVTYFEPVKIVQSEDIVSVSISELVIGGQYVDLSTEFNGVKVLDKKIHYCDTFVIAKKNLPTTIVFSAGSWLPKEKVSYSYVFDGEKEVTIPMGSNTLFFDGMDYGTYKLDVRAYYSNSVSPQKTYVFIVPAPFYLSNVAKVIYVLLAVSIVFSIFWCKYKQLKKRSIIVETNFEERRSDAWFQLLENIGSNYSSDELNRSDFSSNIHDFIKLSKDEVKLTFEQVEIVNFVRQLGEKFRNSFEEKQLNYVFHSDYPSLNVKINKEKIGRVIDILICNSIKFTETQGNIQLGIENNPDDVSSFYITVSDTGVGMPEGFEMSKIYDMLFQLNKKTGDDFVTCMSLYVANGYLMLHGGGLEFRRGNPSGSILICRIKL